MKRAYLAENRELEARAAFRMAIRFAPLNNSAQKGLRKAKEILIQKRLGEQTITSAKFSHTSPN